MANNQHKNEMWKMANESLNSKSIQNNHKDVSFYAI